jgi:hypothetical protein
VAAYPLTVFTISEDCGFRDFHLSTVGLRAKTASNAISQAIGIIGEELF